jgi:hypothetical protein
MCTAGVYRLRTLYANRFVGLNAAGLDFLTVLGAHEGEGLVVEADAEVAGSRSQWIADNGQRVRTSRCLGVSPCLSPLIPLNTISDTPKTTPDSTCLATAGGRQDCGGVP